MATAQLTWTERTDAPTWFTCDQFPALEAVNNGRKGWTLFWGSITMGTGLSKVRLDSVAGAIVSSHAG
jgi:hypothetical protein